MKCRKCRHRLIDDPENTVVTAHGNRKSTDSSDDCASNRQNSVWYLKEETLPSWVITALDEGDWTRGKLTCPHCQTRVGMFDFVAGSKCSCGKCVIPAVRVVRSKVDYTRVQV